MANNRKAQQEIKAQQEKQKQQEVELQQEAEQEGSQDLPVVGGDQGTGQEEGQGGSQEEGQGEGDIPQVDLEQPIAKPETREAPLYEAEKIVVLLGDSPVAERIAVRLANYCTVVIGATTLEELNPVRNNLTDIVRLLNKAERAEFVKVMPGILKFIHEDLEKHGAKSAMSGIRPFRPFMGYVGPESLFLEVIQSMANPAGRKQFMRTIDHKTLTSFLVQEKKDLFVELFK